MWLTSNIIEQRFESVFDVLFLKNRDVVDSDDAGTTTFAFPTTNLVCRSARSDGFDASMVAFGTVGNDKAKERIITNDGNLKIDQLREG